MRAAIYARYSTELQSDRSIEDQVTLCRAFAAREGLEVVAEFGDRARSGGAMHGRDGLAKLLRLARDGGIEVVVTEALDRLSRDMEDLARIYKTLNFASVSIRAVHEGTVNTVLVGLRGLVGALYREDLAAKVRRGLAGRAADGLVATGLSYGYRTIPGMPGHRTIDEAEAAVVRRIFDLYAGGMSTQAIAKTLTAEGVRPPKGAKCWRASSIKGCGVNNGILNNPIYAGRLVWGRRRSVRDPDTGKALHRMASEGMRVAAEKPDLAIVTPEVWEAAQREIAVRKERGHARQSGRATFVLAGILRCGCCGGPLNSNGLINGRRRIACHSYKEGTPCERPRSFYLDRVQGVVVDALLRELRHPTVTAEFVRAYHERYRQLAAGAGQRRVSIERRIDDLSRERERLIDCIAKGYGDPALLAPRATEAHRAIARLEVELAACDAAPKVVALQPDALARFETMLATLPDRMVAGDTIIAAPIRELVERIDVHSVGRRHSSMRIDITGRLAPLLGFRVQAGNAMWGKDSIPPNTIPTPHLATASFRLTVAA